MNSDRLRIIDLPGGDPHARGRAHGETLRAGVAEMLDRWGEGLGALYGVGRARYVERFHAATRYAATTERLAPGVIAEVRGIAEGANVRFADLLAAQHINEEFELGPAFAAEACSTIILPPAAGRPALIAQNLDLAQYLDGLQILLRCPTGDGSGEILALSVPGMISLNGMNSHGFAVCDNTVNQLRPNPEGLPVYALYRLLLESRTLAEAAALVERIPPATGLNWVMGDPDGVMMIERSGFETAKTPGADGRPVYHTNHPLACSDWAGHDSATGTRPRPARSSYLRYASLHQRLHDADAAVLGVQDLKAVLSARDDPDYPVSRGGGQTVDDMAIGFTLACSVFELDRERPRWHLASGPGHCTEMRVFEFSRPGAG
ncbi:C45 family autoproteolytic acyltransferase/hydolase [Sphingosinicella microcystinivorans]|uniref:C45 family autoproteolytic acyltransferase/hydolase n=1 Tax=Sphingosinicella microcystinivorans TaxID=335406 RepID=UPI0022F39687|nr:C45 family peptidase [Sphingosinicella microcystinivorans]WBX85166.1 C45 family autoproteolytic acyltransferase/hydrolase [Sphingosinicella microcystinivorans]